MNSTTRQYRPVTTSETGANDGLSVRAMHDTADFINNGHAYTFAFKARGIYCFPPADYRSKTDATDEQVVLVLLCPKIPDGLTTFEYNVGHYKYADTASSVIAWKIYCCDRVYNGPDVIDANYLGNYSSVTFNCSGSVGEANNAISTGRGPTIKRDPEGWSYFVITATPAILTCQSALTSIDLVPRE